LDPFGLTPVFDHVDGKGASWRALHGVEKFSEYPFRGKDNPSFFHNTIPDVFGLFVEVIPPVGERQQRGSIKKHE
jgi:hypothetical protein